MAKIEDLVAQIGDERLRLALMGEVKELKRRKPFGLVFEDHLPETVRLPRLPVRAGELVAEKRLGGNRIWRVETLKRGRAVCRSAADTSQPGDGTAGATKTEFAISDLVVVRSFGDAIYPALTPLDRIERGGEGKPWHVLINADNFHALQLLLYTSERQVDVIYIDPPYNSGARDWKYNNDYVDKTDSFRHSKWLSMMKKRLLLAKRLLRSDGVLIVTIDENEVYHLGVLLEQIFDEYLRHSVTIVINPKGTGKINFGRTEEYALFCVPKTGSPVISGNHLADLASVHDEEDQEVEESADEEDEENGDAGDGEAELKAADSGDETSEWNKPFPREEASQWELRHARRRGSESSYRHQRPNQFYPIYIDEDEKVVVDIGDSIPVDAKPTVKGRRGLTAVWPIDNEGNDRCWRFIPSSMRRILDEGRLVVGQQNPTTKRWTLNIWEPKNKQKKVKTVWWNTRHDAGTHGTTMLHGLLGRRAAFPFPKSLYAVRDALLTVVADRPNALIVDFFAGSGTTAHAVALINAQLGGTRRSIMVSNNEPGEKLAKQLGRRGYFVGDDEFEEHGICESVTWPRCRAALTGEREGGQKLDGKYLPMPGHVQQRRFSEGFDENMEYLRLDFVDPSEVERGDAFTAILPILWLMSGCGRRRPERPKKSSQWLLPKDSAFAVLLDERAFPKFRTELQQNAGRVEWVFLVTDSEENFALMRRLLGRDYESVQLYKSYLENFRLNTPEFLAA